MTETDPSERDAALDQALIYHILQRRTAVVLFISYKSGRHVVFTCILIIVFIKLRVFCYPWNVKTH